MRILGYIALLFWLFLSWKYWTDYKQCNPSKALPVGTANSECPLCFEWSSPTVNTCDSWSDYRDSLLSAIGQNNKLLITGQFSRNESTDDELGRNRAISVKALFNGLLPEENIVLDIEEIDESKHQNCKSHVKLDMLMNGRVVPDNSLTSAVFFLESNQFVNNAAILVHINEVAAHVKDSSEKIRITGHTDDQGSQKENIKRGYNYADQMKSYFIEKGVPLEQLITISKGENESVSNDSSGDQYFNRVEVTITKS